MSENGFSDGFDNEYARLDDPGMEINIQTLMGTSFNIKVAPSDTIGDIKRKIYRIEGIPIYQQSLLFQYRELKDTWRLDDAGIINGSNLTLISAMRGGPISTRRLSVACEHHVVLKELKDILDNTRDDLGPGSKVSVLVFKEGDVINLLRVIENEDGSYSPYSNLSSSSSSSDRAPSITSPPPKPVRKESRTGIFERLVEDNEMSTKICNLRKKMEELVLKRQEIGKKTVSKNYATDETQNSSPDKNSSLTYKLLSQCNDFIDNMDLKIYEKNFEEENEEEIALKDKHRSKLLNLPTRSSDTRTFYKDSKGVHSHTKHIYARTHKKNRESASLLKDHFHQEKVRIPEISSISSKSSSISNSSKSLPPLTKSDFSSKVADISTKITDYSAKIADFSSKIAEFSSTRGEYSTTTARGSELPDKVITPSVGEQFTIFKDDDYTKSLSVPSGNRIHLTRLVLSETERPKSSPDGIELEENAQDLWEIHEPSTERLKHSATCSKIGLLKRPQSLEFAYEGIENHSTHQKAELGNYTCKNSNYEVCSGNFYHMPQFVTTPGGTCRGGGRGIAPKDQSLCDYYFAKPSDRSPLYGRTTAATVTKQDVSAATAPVSKSRNLIHRASEAKFSAATAELTGSSGATNFLTDCPTSNIQRLRNDDCGVTKSGCDSLFSVHDESIDELYGYYNLGCSASPLEESENTSNTDDGVVDAPSTKGSSESDTEKTKIDDKESSTSKKQKIEEKPPELPPPVIKKKARCSECNKRLNITNIYDCRCGKMFCSQHRYPEVHRCTYDYKLEGRKILKQQNPLVTAEKVAKI